MNYSNQKNKCNKGKVSITKAPFRSITHAAMKLEKGVALLEALIAILIFSFGVLGIVGLQSAMVKGTSQNKLRTDASYIVERRIAMMWGNAANLAGFSEPAPGTVVPELPNGRRITQLVSAANGEVRVTVTWQMPGESQHNYAATAFIVGAN